MTFRPYLVFPLIVAATSVPTTVFAATYWFKSADISTPELAHHLELTNKLSHYFGRIDTKDGVDFYTFDAKKGESFTFSIKTPQADGDFQTDLILFGPGFAATKEKLPFAIGDDNGAFIAQLDKPTRDSKNEHSWLTTFYLGPRIDAVAPKDGVYALAVHGHDANVGRYVLTTGSEDKFSFANLANELVGIIRAIFRRY